MSDNLATTDFGFRQVSRTAKAGMVRAVFDSVAPVSYTHLPPCRSTCP